MAVMFNEKTYILCDYLTKSSPEQVERDADTSETDSDTKVS